MPVITVDNTRLSYQFDGDERNPVLILSNSLGTDIGMWSPQIPDLRPHFRILRYDTRGLGSSDAPPGDYTIERLGRDVLALADALTIPKFAFAGVSLGGMTGQWLGANAPDRVSALILSNTSPFLGPKSNWDERRKAVLEGGMASVVDLVMSRYFSPETLAKNDPIISSTKATFLATNPVGYAGCCAAIRDMDNRAILSKITTPTLVISGDQDASTPFPGHGEVLAREIPGAKNLLLSGAHLSNIEQPQLFNSAVLDFLIPRFSLAASD